ncbi:hypothetical protein, variant 1 [Aphanomyces invadans]|uniref:Uncharacterized protein n=1 Tax=Aphanomyces invadans TaxID=157072 RepID=A0A024U3V1_9STRA|nr:hypothetical protein, variant 1 [Aphanomyces invadans]ETW00582.1 hypothetical protein, variant 1 [Aphanomyces invadans]|eukprot:XP_008870717.1 hypothetical protein, variant 1 [Aphanomyces invadans]
MKCLSEGIPRRRRTARTVAAAPATFAPSKTQKTAVAQFEHFSDLFRGVSHSMKGREVEASSLAVALNTSRRHHDDYIQLDYARFRGPHDADMSASLVFIRPVAGSSPWIEAWKVASSFRRFKFDSSTARNATRSRQHGAQELRDVSWWNGMRCEGDQKYRTRSQRQGSSAPLRGCWTSAFLFRNKQN